MCHKRKNKKNKVINLKEIIEEGIAETIGFPKYVRNEEE